MKIILVVLFKSPDFTVAWNLTLFCFIIIVQDCYDTIFQFCSFFFLKMKNILYELLYWKESFLSSIHPCCRNIMKCGKGWKRLISDLLDSGFWGKMVGLFLVREGQYFLFISEFDLGDNHGVSLVSNSTP